MHCEPIATPLRFRCRLMYRINKLEITARVGHAEDTTVLSTVYTVGASSIIDLVPSYSSKG